MLPLQQTSLQDLSLLQTKWKSELDPLLVAPFAQGFILENVALANGTTQVNHLLSRPLQGWLVVRQRALASIYDTQDSNTTPAVTLTLVSSAAVVVDLFVF